MIIKKVSQQEIKQVVDLINKGFDKYMACNYPNESRKLFKEEHSYDKIVEQYNNYELELWGCFEDENIIGIIGVKNSNNICMLYVDENYQRKGIAKCLFNMIYDKSKFNKSLNELTVISPLFCMEMFYKLGFVSSGAEQELNGIDVVPMSINLYRY